MILNRFNKEDASSHYYLCPECDPHSEDDVLVDTIEDYSGYYSCDVCDCNHLDQE